MKKYDSTVARIAGNLLSGNYDKSLNFAENAQRAVELARAIVAETERTEPEAK